MLHIGWTKEQKKHVQEAVVSYGQWHWKGVSHLVTSVTINTRYHVTSQEILSSFPDINCDQSIQAPLHCLYLAMINEESLDFIMHLI